MAILNFSKVESFRSLDFPQKIFPFSHPPSLPLPLPPFSSSSRSLSFPCMLLGIEPKTSYMLSMSFTTEVTPIQFPEYINSKHFKDENLSLRIGVGFDFEM